MNAKIVYQLIKPHLSGLSTDERKTLSKLINSVPAPRIGRHHRKIASVSEIKNKLKSACYKEMQLEQKA